MLWALATPVFVLAFLAGGSPENGNAEVPMTLLWDAPRSCPDLAYVKQRIRALLGNDLHSRLPDVLDAQVHVRALPGGTWQLDLTTRTSDVLGERQLAAADCAQLADAAAFVLALMINPEAGSVAAQPAVALPILSNPVASPEAALARRWSMGADFLLGTGAVPGLAQGVGLRGSFDRSALGIQARGTMWLPRPAHNTDRPEVGGSFSLVTLALAGCLHSSLDRRVGGEACLGGNLSRMAGTGLGISNPKDTVAWWPSLLADAAVRVALVRPVAARLDVEVQVPLGRPAFAIDGVGLVYKPPAGSVRAATGLEVRF